MDLQVLILKQMAEAKDAMKKKINRKEFKDSIREVLV